MTGGVEGIVRVLKMIFSPLKHLYMTFFYLTRHQATVKEHVCLIQAL